MTDAFDEEQADFRGIGTSDKGNIYINMVLHKTYIEVDEQGTKRELQQLSEWRKRCPYMNLK